MNAETNKIKDIYLDVLKPVVDKLYTMQVFYSREVARVLSSDVLSTLFIFLYFFHLVFVLLLLLYRSCQQIPEQAQLLKLSTDNFRSITCTNGKRIVHNHLGNYVPFNSLIVFLPSRCKHSLTH